MRAQAQRSLIQAKRFLAAAELIRSNGLTNPSVAAAVHAVIHAKDAICLERTGRTKGTKNRLDAIKELETLGVIPRKQIEQCRSVLGAKSRSEYDSEDFTPGQADVIHARATRFCHFVFEYLSFS